MCCLNLCLARLRLEAPNQISGPAPDTASGRTLNKRLSFIHPDTALLLRLLLRLRLVS